MNMRCTVVIRRAFPHKPHLPIKRVTIFLALMILAAIVSGCGPGSTRLATTPSQVGLLSTYPGVLDAVMAADGLRGPVVMYGGRPFMANVTPSFDTWLWNGRVWQRYTQADGPELSSPSIGYDRGSGQLLLVGISGGSPAHVDTWTWTDRGWSRLRPATALPTYWAASTLVPFNSGLLLYLERPITQGVAEGTYDMWFWNGKDWRLQANSSATPDRFVQHFVSLPGGGAGAVSGTRVARWTGTTWDERQASNGPATISAVAIDPGSGHLVAIGSRRTSIPDLPPPVDSSFVFDGANWTSTPLPADLKGKVGMEMAGYAAQPAIALWGGTQGYGNAGAPQTGSFQAAMWYWNGRQWTRVAQGA